MDKVVDHLLVFKGDGVVKDFPGNYTQYREWAALEGNEKGVNGSERGVKATSPSSARFSTTEQSSPSLPNKRKMTYKEKREFEQLEKDIAVLEAEKKQIEEALCGGTTSVEEITKLSKRLPLLKDELDEKSMRWLELSEISS